MVKLLISGWYGFGNLGDEAILVSIAATLRNVIPDVRVQALSFNPEFTESFQSIEAYPQLPQGAKSWLKSLVSGNLVDTLSAFMKCDILLLGGGGFLSDWQPEAPWIWLRQALLAKLLGKKVMLYGIGAGPFKRPFGKWVTRKLINTCVQKITVRDDKSRQWLLLAGVREDLIVVTADPAVNYPVSRAHVPVSKPSKIGICVAPIFQSEQFWPGKNDKYLKYVAAMSELVSGLTDEGFEVVFIPMQESSDVPFAQKILEGVNKDVSIARLPDKIADVVTLLSGVDLLITMRLHAAILGAAQGVPVAAIVYHDKVAEFINSIGMLEFVEELGDGSNWRETDIDPARLVSKVKSIALDYEVIRDNMSRKICELRGLEKGNIDSLRELMEKMI